MNKRHGSPEKHGRVDGYMGSHGMKQSLSYQDNDITYSLVNTKPTNKTLFTKQAYKRENWKPKANAQWVEEKGHRLTLQ